MSANKIHTKVIKFVYFNFGEFSEIAKKISKNVIPAQKKQTQAIYKVLTMLSMSIQL